MEFRAAFGSGYKMDGNGSVEVVNPSSQWCKSFFAGTEIAAKRLTIFLSDEEITNVQVSSHTFRHWKATMEYHKTKDILHVMQLLGHRNIKNTLIYTQLVRFKDDEYTARVAKTEEEICDLVESGFEYLCDYNS